MKPLFNRKLADLTSPSAVHQAIAEYDRLGKKAFLAKYGFGPAHRYFLVQDGREYDSKAIAGAAFGYQYPERGPLTPQEFSGGERTVQARLEALGFTLRVLPRTWSPKHVAPAGAELVQRQLLEVLPERADVVFLAGARYRENLVPFLRAHGFPVTIPLEGLSLGRQLQRLGEIS